MSSPFKPVVVPNTECIKCKHFRSNPLFRVSTKHATQFGLCNRVKINYDALRDSEFEYAYVAREVRCKGDFYEAPKEDGF